MDADRLTYAYLAGSLLFVPVWLWLFVRNPAGQREMLVMSGLFVVTIGVPLELLLYSKDWWHPKTITGTPLGVEDVIYSIGNGGYMAGLFGGLFTAWQPRQGPRPGWLLRALPLAVMVAVPLVLFYAFGLHSFTAVSIGSLLALGIMLVVRPDLTRIAVVTGLVGTALAIPVYLAMELAFPGLVAVTWDLPRLSGLLPLGIPIEDLAWYLYTAAAWGVYYKYATGLRLVAPAKISHRRMSPAQVDTIL